MLDKAIPEAEAVFSYAFALPDPTPVLLKLIDQG